MKEAPLSGKSGTIHRPSALQSEQVMRFLGDVLAPARQSEPLLPELSQELKSLLQNKLYSTAAKKLAELLDPEQAPDRQLAAISVLSLLSSSEPKEKECGRQLLDLLNKAQTQVAACNLASMSSFDPDRLPQALALLNTPGEQQRTADLLQLFQNKDQSVVSAAFHLITHLSAADATQREDGQKLLCLLSGKNMGAVDISNGIRDSAQLRDRHAVADGGKDFFRHLSDPNQSWHV